MIPANTNDERNINQLDTSMLMLYNKNLMIIPNKQPTIAVIARKIVKKYVVYPGLSA